MKKGEGNVDRNYSGLVGSDYVSSTVRAPNRVGVSLVILYLTTIKGKLTEIIDELN